MAYDRLSNWYDPMYRAMGMRETFIEPRLTESFVSLVQRIGAVDVLDCACGTGNPIIGMKQLAPDLRIAGTDANQRMLSQCVLNALSAGVAIQPLSGSGDDDGLRLGISTWDQLSSVVAPTFDLVMCRGHSVYHLITRSAIIDAIRKMADVLKPGGYVLLDALRWTSDLRGEDGRDHVRFRGWLPADDPANPLGARVMFVDSLSYRDDPTAVRGVIQRKSLVVLGEFAEGAHV
ncbi:MAG TPA: methyltransferase domain-containing protein, partial [Longimicrobium sp.]|nr:methyltransferase domain-containing protein [Longimicrobium sp.]